MNDKWIYDKFLDQIVYQKNKTTLVTIPDLNKKSLEQWRRYLLKQPWHLNSSLSQFENAYAYRTTNRISNNSVHKPDTE